MGVSLKLFIHLPPKIPTTFKALIKPHRTHAFCVPENGTLRTSIAVHRKINAKYPQHYLQQAWCPRAGWWRRVQGKHSQNEMAWHHKLRSQYWLSDRP